MLVKIQHSGFCVLGIWNNHYQEADIATTLAECFIQCLLNIQPNVIWIFFYKITSMFISDIAAIFKTLIARHIWFLFWGSIQNITLQIFQQKHYPDATFRLKWIDNTTSQQIEKMYFKINLGIKVLLLKLTAKGRLSETRLDSFILLSDYMLKKSFWDNAWGSKCFVTIAAYSLFLLW